MVPELATTYMSFLKGIIMKMVDVEIYDDDNNDDDDDDHHHHRCYHHRQQKQQQHPVHYSKQMRIMIDDNLNNIAFHVLLTSHKSFFNIREQ